MRVELSNKPDADRVDATVGGERFSAYRWGDADVLAKPVCYPIRAPGGRAVTRGYPLDPRPGERVDHPHHVGFWLNYGDVNGHDFWNNAGDGGAGMGRIRHAGIDRLASGAPAELRVRSEWLDSHSRTHLTERTTYRFHADRERRAIDRCTTLTAERDVTFRDDKEGMCAIRVRAELEHPEDDTATVVDDPVEGTTTSGRVDENRSGEYLTSEGVRGTAAWGTRAEWVRLSGVIDDAPVTVTLMDHPENAGHPTYWHARGYGLFSANPLGQAVFSSGDRRLGLQLDAEESVAFRHRLVVDTGEPSAEELDCRYQSFVDETSP